MKFLSLLVLLCLPATAMAEKNDIPLNELGFVDSVPRADKAHILEQLGEPASQFQIRDKGGDVVAAIWHYHYLNTSEEGDYYKTTELDFIGDRVVNIVFSNVDDEEDNQAALPALECATSC